MPARSAVGVSKYEARDQNLMLGRNRRILTKRHIRQAFGRFTRLDNEITRRTPGTGLGLSISRRITEGMGGTVVLVSRMGFVEVRQRVPTLSR